MLASISTARKSSRMDGVRPPPRKNTSRILAARSNWASAAADTAPCPATGLYFQGRLLVSTRGARRFWKKSSISPPGLNSWPKSSGSTSRVLLATRG